MTGGTDRTAEIVKKYEEKYPDIVKLVHKENGGYGSTINSSITLAKGKYFKQLDGDDWFDKSNFKKILELLRSVDTDIVYTPYVIKNEKNGEQKFIDFFSNDIQGKYQTEEIRYLSMYTLTYRTKILRENNIKLLEKCLYTDTEYALYPMIYCKEIYITHDPVYVYRIGRDEQSVSLNSRVKHYEEHIKVTKRLIKFLEKTQKEKSKNIAEYVKGYVSHMAACSIGDFLILLPQNKENLNKIKEFEKYLYDNKKDVYFEIEKISRLVKLLRKSKYTLYPLLSYYKRRKYR